MGPSVNGDGLPGRIKVRGDHFCLGKNPNDGKQRGDGSANIYTWCWPPMHRTWITCPLDSLVWIFYIQNLTFNFASSDDLDCLAQRERVELHLLRASWRSLDFETDYMSRTRVCSPIVKVLLLESEPLFPEQNWGSYVSSTSSRWGNAG